MTRLVLSDALIRDSLRPDPSIAAPAGLLAAIRADVARTPQRRMLRLPALPRSRQLAWIAVAAATLVALAGVLLFAAGGRKSFQAIVPPAPSALAAPSPFLADLPVTGGAGWAEIIAISADEAWTTAGDRLWHRTAARGWEPVAVSPLRDAPGSWTEPDASEIRDLDRLPDGRIVIGADSGIYVGDESGWMRVWGSVDHGGRSAFGVAVDAAGVIRAPSLREGGGNVDVLSITDRESRGVQGSDVCPAGGSLVATASDGSVWTAGYDYVGTGGVARLDGDTCDQLFPFVDGLRHDVTGIAADGQGRVAMVVMDTRVDGVAPGGRVVVWEDGRWTTLHEGEGLARGMAFNTLSYAPDGSLWIAFDEKLWRFEGTEATPVRDAAIAPVSVAPDGTVWYIGIVDGQAAVTRLLPGEAQPQAPSPTAAPSASAAPSPLVQELPFDGIFGSIVGVSADEAWAMSGTRLWHRTAATGWTPVAGGPPYDLPPRPIDTAVSQTRDLDRLPDGRIVIGSDRGVYVGDESGWTRVWQGRDAPAAWIHGVGVDAAGMIWAPSVVDSQGSGLRSFEAVGGTWRNAWHAGCPAGGMVVAPASDGTVWTAGIDYSAASGVARLDGESCTQQFPFGDGLRHDVSAIAADGQGRVAMVVFDTQVRGTSPGGRLVVWEKGHWTTLYEDEALVGFAPDALSYAPDGSLWIAFAEKLWRFEGTKATPIRDVGAMGVSVAPDGAVWYVGLVDGRPVVTRLLPDEARP